MQTCIACTDFIEDLRTVILTIEPMLFSNAQTWFERFRRSATVGEPDDGLIQDLHRIFIHVSLSDTISVLKVLGCTQDEWMKLWLSNKACNGWKEFSPVRETMTIRGLVGFGPSMGSKLFNAPRPETETDCEW